MASPQDVLDYIRSRFHLSGEVQMHKLLYYSQAWHMVWNGRPLFSEPIEAWRMGPVVPSLRFALGIPRMNEPQLTQVEMAAIDDVLRHYGVHYGWTLSERTHQELPWVVTRGDLPASANSDREIPRRLIRSFYTEQSMRGEGPTKTETARVVAGDDEVLAAARRNQERWKGALDLLAQ